MKRTSAVLYQIGLLGFVVLLLPALALSATYARTKKPTLVLFPKNVASNIKEVTENSREMEKGLEPIMNKLKTQMELYKASNCDGDDPDSGCSQIKKQIEENYSQMLSVLEENLPEINKKLSSTNKILGKKLSREIGFRMTPGQLQETISKGSMPPVVRGRARLSRYYSNLYKKLAKHGNNNKTIAMMAAEIYRDNRAAQQWIEYLNAEISQQRIFLTQVSELGIIPDEMISYVSEVQEMIFPEDAPYPDGGGDDLTPPQTETKSELED